MSKIGPIGYREFNRNRDILRKVPVHTSKTEFEPNADSFSTANPTKKVDFSSAVSANFSAKSVNNQADDLLKRANKILKQADRIITNSNKEYLNAIEIISNAQNGTYEVYQTETEDRDILGNLFIIGENEAVRIVNKTSGLDIALYKDFSGDCDKHSAGEIYEFSNQKLIAYLKNATFDGKKESAESIFNFNKNGLFDYKEEYEANGEEINSKKEFGFFDNKLRKYFENIQIGNTVSKINKSFYFDENGNLDEYRSETSMNYNTENKTLNTSSKTKYINKDGKLIKENN